MAIQEVRVPDIGDFKEVEIIEVLVKVGDSIQAEDSLIAVESDKASMEIPAPTAGIVKEVRVQQGDRVSKGSLILTLELQTHIEKKPPVASNSITSPASAGTHLHPFDLKANPTASAPKAPSQAKTVVDHEAFKKAYATPSVRKFARELGVDLSRVAGSGRKQRITQEDVKGYIKDVMGLGLQSKNAATSNSGLGIPRMPEIDFSQWGEIDTVRLNRINKLTGEFLHRNWLNVPHVTQFDQADITDLEAFRQELNLEQEKIKAPKITPLVFIMKAVVAGLKAYPRFNTSLDPSGEMLIQKKYYHIGIAVDTPDGLVVPIIRDVDKKSLLQLTDDLKEISAKARERRLKPADLQGGCFSISSLGGIGGTKFTPIINAPDVAILGISKSAMQPIWNGQAFAPRLMLPLSLSYDHRVIDGADGARFTTFLAKMLGDIRRLLV
ncbi:MAG: dihydrolipoyllysine-residue acetyltransferase [Thiolinea sp.]